VEGKQLKTKSPPAAPKTKKPSPTKADDGSTLNYSNLKIK